MDTNPALSIYQYKPLLFSIAYQMLGDTQEAKDIVQDTFESWLSKENIVINAKSYLTKVTVNKAIDRLKQLQKKRESYTGTWLPIPVIHETDAEMQIRDKGQELSYAVLSMLEKLNPIERAVFILREAFDYSYAEIADFCTSNQENCRQLLHRAKEKLQLSKIRYTADPQKHQELLEAFLLACDEENMEKLTHLLKEDIILFSDGGGKAKAALNPLFGSINVIKFLLGVLRKSKDFQPKFTLVNGQPGTLLINSATGNVDSVLTLEVEDGQISKIFYIRNPDKLMLIKE